MLMGSRGSGIFSILVIYGDCAVAVSAYLELFFEEGNRIIDLNEDQGYRLLGRDRSKMQ